MSKFIPIVAISLVLIGCSTFNRAEYMASSEYQKRNDLRNSLFKSDKMTISNEDVEKILNSKIKIPDKLHIAIIKIPANKEREYYLRHYGYYYWRDEAFIDLNKKYSDILSNKISKSKKAKIVSVVPALMVSKDYSLPLLREAAVRMQSHILFLYRIESDIFEKFRLFRRNQVKAYATCEVVLLDVKTGIIPYTNIITEKLLTTKSNSDLDMNETRKRAESEAILKCLAKAGDNTKIFLDTIP